MRRIWSLILAVLLCMAPALPALAAEDYAPITIMDGDTAITFSAARRESRPLMLARQIWAPGSTAAVNSASERTELELIVVKRGSTIGRSASNGALTLSFLTKSGSGYLLTEDRLALNALSFSADNLFAYPFAKVELCRMTLSDGTEYYIVSGDTVLTEAPPIPIDYEVKQGDNLNAIALNYYGVQGLGDALQKANPEHFEATDGILEAGRNLTLPPQLDGHPRLPEPLAGENEVIYIVRAGDTLGSIAQKSYGKSEYYTYIYQRNAGRMKGPGILQVGQLLVLPVISVAR